MAGDTFEQLGRRIAVQEREQSRAVQIAAGRVDLKPLPRMSARPFRAWLTIEQASLFVANDYEGDSFSFTQEIKHPETAERGMKRVTVGKVDATSQRRFGVLRQVHQEVYHLLLELWGEDGHPVLPSKDPLCAYGQLVRSRYALVTAVGGKLVLGRSDGDVYRVREPNASGKEYVRVRELVRSLASVPILIEVEWSSGQVESCEFTLLQGVTWRSKLDADGEGRAEVSILFSDVVTRGFLDKELKLMLAQPYEQIGALEPDKPQGKRRRGGYGQEALAKLLYRHLEGQLANKDTYHVAVDALAQRLGFTRYKFLSDRLRKLRPSIVLLDGMRLPILPGNRRGYVLRVALEEGAERQGVLRARREVCDEAQLDLFDDAQQS